jgi:hypothetical protein
MSDEHKMKHLEFIQNIITRMNSNSFMVKGWAVTLVAALFALSDEDTNKYFYMIALIPIPAFWFLDGFFLATERRYRELYDYVTLKKEEDINFNLNSYFNIALVKAKKGKELTFKQKYANWKLLNCSKLKYWFCGTFSITLFVFYGIIAVMVFVIKSILNG